MAELIQDFAQPVHSQQGAPYRARLHGQQRTDGMWEGWLAFGQDAGGLEIKTGIETTQPNRQALLYWATGLGDTYFEGALARASSVPHPPAVAHIAVEIVEDNASRRTRLAAVEQYVMNQFRDAAATRLLAKDLFAGGAPYSNADLVRAFEELQRQRLLIRRSEEGNDWLFLTELGTREVL